MIDHDRPPVVIDDQPDADPLLWLRWIVENHPYVTEEGQVVLIDGALLTHLCAGRPKPPDYTVASIAWHIAFCAAQTKNDPDLPQILVAIDETGGRHPFPAPVPARIRLEDSRTFWPGPVVRQLVEEFAACGS